MSTPINNNNNNNNKNNYCGIVICQSLFQVSNNSINSHKVSTIIHSSHLFSTHEETETKKLIQETGYYGMKPQSEPKQVLVPNPE